MYFSPFCFNISLFVLHATGFLFSHDSPLCFFPPSKKTVASKV